MIARALILLLLAAPVAAETPLSAEAFDAYTRGKTLYYGHAGQAYGVERYLDDRRVVWSFLDGKCRNGFWYEDAGLICFLYEDRRDPQCWSFAQTQSGLIARFENSTEQTELYEAQDIGQDMVCHGPDVGV
ncbi:hypothetical protein [Pukyongiella litopenaei]|uniref:Uncharacterized protein n=1 Tax=Pukyongiella litopenaei TaxID=2605946 RepID=A0A2S0MM41_9RHOB|nr:hypothetical protein [Pukyongiella litopenaei]AVO36950.1 hypothetical protein C6Y53_04050 [Pukyongiella litopenaei]